MIIAFSWEVEEEKKDKVRKKISRNL